MMLIKQVFKVFNKVKSNSQVQGKDLHEYLINDPTKQYKITMNVISEKGKVIHFVSIIL